MNIYNRKNLKPWLVPATLLVILAGVFVARTAFARIVFNTIDPVDIVADQGRQVTVSQGGKSGAGTVFAVNTDGTGFTNLHSFTFNDGANPQARLILSGYALYGTAKEGGGSDFGTVFSLSFAPQLTITPSGSYLALSWPTNVAGFDYTGYRLQSTMNLIPPVRWTTVFGAPVVVNGQNTVTIPIDSARKFFRLIK